MADAKTQGTVGPNLDDAFSSDKDQGFSQQTIADVVRGQIAYADPQGAMKPNIVTGADADSVALYVAKCSAVPSCGVTAASAAPPPTTTTGGSTTTAAAPPGKAIFEQNCATCHTLKDAGATGSVGPNLDALKPSEPRVARQVRTGGAIMPSFASKLSAQQIAEVAKYVSSVAGK